MSNSKIGANDLIEIFGIGVVFLGLVIAGLELRRYVIKDKHLNVIATEKGSRPATGSPAKNGRCH